MSDSGKKRRNGPPAGEGGPRKKKGHYVASATGRSTSDKAMPIGSSGLLVTCDSGREFKAFDEMIRLLEDSFQRMGKDHVGRKPAADTAAKAADKPAGKPADGAAAADSEAAGDAAAAAGGSKAPSISDMLAAEVADIKKERVHRFKKHNTDVRGTFFVEFPKDEDCPAPEDVALEIAQHVQATRSLPARFVMRLLPASLTCFASMDDLKDVAATMVERYFGTDGDKAKGPAEFAVEYEHRSSDKLKRTEVIDLLAKAVPQPPYKVSLSNPARTIVVQLVRNAVALSVVTSFKQMAKFNLRRLTEEEEDGEGKEGEAGEAEAAAEAAPAAAADKGADASAELAAQAADKAE